MLPQTQIKPLMAKLGIKKEKNAVLFLARLKGWIEKNGNTTISLSKGINKILEDINDKEIKEAQKLKEINLGNIKNPLLKKYAKEIIRLNKEEGLGVRRIEKWIWENHRAKISYSSIYRLLKQQKA
jgi:ABC-type nitrate/sulfonate/bicarbonate transport system substrate-binding protein